MTMSHLLNEAQIVSDDLKLIPAGEWRDYKVSVVHKGGKYVALLLWDGLSNTFTVLTNMSEHRELEAAGYPTPHSPLHTIENNTVYRNLKKLKQDLLK